MLHNHVGLNHVNGRASNLCHCLNMASLCLSYQRLLQTIGVLEAQRNQAVLDLEALARHQKEALSNPIEFVEQLQKQVTDLYTLLYFLFFFIF